MKILWISHFLLFPETGYGALQRSRNLLLELSKRHDVFLISYYRKSDLDRVRDLEEARRDLQKYCQRVVFLPFPRAEGRYSKYVLFLKSLFRRIPYSILLYRSGSLFTAVSKLMDETHIDLVHSDTMGLFENLLEERAVTRILNHHNIESEMMFRRANKEKNVLRKALLRLEAYKIRKYEVRFCREYASNLVVSESDQNTLQGICTNIKTAVVQNGVDGDYYAHHLRESTGKGLIFTGSLDWYPNGDAMLFFCREIWPQLKAKFPDLKTMIIGKNPPAELSALISKERNIDLKGYVPDVREYVRKARIFICPIRDGGGTRLKILDALAQGIPVVSTEIGCEGLHLKNGEEILIAKTNDEFIDHIGILISDRALCNRLSENGRRMIEKKYLFNVIGNNLSGHYERLHECRAGGTQFSILNEKDSA